MYEATCSACGTVVRWDDAKVVPDCPVCKVPIKIDFASVLLQSTGVLLNGHHRVETK